MGLNVFAGLSPKVLCSYVCILAQDSIFKWSDCEFVIKKIVMWMLREDQDIVNTVVKTVRFFPSRLPQYYECSRREMYLMRKNHQDFKSLAQTLAMDKTKRKAYIKDLMEDQYGECYAQKLEDRLLNYLQELEAVLPTDTYIDQLLRQEHPRSYEEELLCSFITRYPTSIPTSLKRLLLCATSTSKCHASVGAQKEGGTPAMEMGEGHQCEIPGPIRKRVFKERLSQPKRTSPYRTLSTCQGNRVERCPSLGLGSLHVCVEEQGMELQVVTVEVSGGDVDKDSPLLLEEEDLDGKERGGTEEEAEVWMEGVQEVDEKDPDGKERWRGRAAVGMEGMRRDEKVDVDEEGTDGEERSQGRPEEEIEEEGLDMEVIDEVRDRQKCDAVQEVSPLQLCSRHQRWVRSILQECSEEQILVQTGDYAPAVHQGSPSTSSSLDLTPSLPLYPPHNLPPHRQTPSHSICLPQHLPPPIHTSSPSQIPTRPPPVALPQSPQPMALPQHTTSSHRLLSVQALGTPDRPEVGRRTHRVQVRMSVETQALLLQSKLLQPYVLLRKLTPQECISVTESRSTRNLLSGEQDSEDDDDEEVEEESVKQSQRPVYSHFDMNTLYSSCDSSSEEEPGSLHSDPDYLPHGYY